jgi:hypothetical protein
MSLSLSIPELTTPTIFSGLKLNCFQEFDNDKLLSIKELRSTSEKSSFVHQKRSFWIQQELAYHKVVSNTGTCDRRVISLYVMYACVMHTNSLVRTLLNTHSFRWLRMPLGFQLELVAVTVIVTLGQTQIDVRTFGRWFGRSKINY